MVFKMSGFSLSLMTGGAASSRFLILRSNFISGAQSLTAAAAMKISAGRAASQAASISRAVGILIIVMDGV